jgi:hypothetical protein
MQILQKEARKLGPLERCSQNSVSICTSLVNHSALWLMSFQKGREQNLEELILPSYEVLDLICEVERESLRLLCWLSDAKFEKQLVQIISRTDLILDIS